MRKRSHQPVHGHNPGFFTGHKLKAFTRFELFPEMLLAARIKSAPQIVTEALDFFVHRFPPFVIALYNESEQKLCVLSKRKEFPISIQRSFDSFENAMDWLRPQVQYFVSQRMELSVEWTPKLFERFFETQFIENRRNTRLQKQMMPIEILDRDSVEYHSLKKFKRHGTNTRLTEFFFEKIPVTNHATVLVQKSGVFKPKNSD